MFVSTTEIINKNDVITLLCPTFQAVNVKHNKVGETNEPGMYRINDDLVTLCLLYQLSTVKLNKLM